MRSRRGGTMARLPRGRERLIGGVAVGAMLAAFVVVYLLLRGGDDGPAGALPAGEQTPQATASAFTASSLPGEGWTTSETELVGLFDAPDPLFAATPDLPECAPIQAFEGALAANEAAFAGGESLLFEREMPDGGMVRVTRLSATFSDAAAVSAILADARKAFDGEALPLCVLAGAARGGIEATATDGAELPVPAGGVSRVLRYKAAPAAGGGTVTQAVAWWGQGERLVVLTIASAGEGLSDAELAGIVTAAGGTP